MRTLILTLFIFCFSSWAYAVGDEPAYNWQTVELAKKLSLEELEQRWAKLHREDNYPYPSEQNLTQRLGKNSELNKQYQNQDLALIAQKQRLAWQAFHNGELEKAYNLGIELGHFGAIVATHARFLNIYYVRVDKAVREQAFDQTQAFIKQFYEREPDNPAMQFAYAHISSRKLQELKFSTKRIFEYRALNKLLKQILEQNPEHVGAGLLLAGFHAEGAVKSKFLARIRYGSSIKKAIEGFEDTLKLAPHSIMGNAAFAVQLIRFKQAKYEKHAQAQLQLLLTSPAEDANELLVHKHAQFLIGAIEKQQIPDFIYF